MRLAAEPEDDPSDEPITATNKEPDASGDATTLEFLTTGDIYDNNVESKAERMSTDIATLGDEAKPSAIFNRKAEEAFHSVICAADPPVDDLGDDSSEDICLPYTVANADPVTGRLIANTEDTETPTKVNNCVALPARMLEDEITGK